MNTIKRNLLNLGVLLVLALLGLAAAWASPAQAATLPAATCLLVETTRTCELWATTGALNLPGSPGMPIWGFSLVSTAGSAVLPGPAIIANHGETLQVILHNGLSEQLAMQFPGQAMRPDLTGVAPGGMTTYSFVLSSPGTFLYEAGLLPNAQHQVALGLYGALIVRPLGAPLQAYADPATVFQDEALLVLSEIDPALNNAAIPANFDMRNFKPKYWLINGEAYPDTDEIPSAAGNTVLLRIVNAGVDDHSLGALGLVQTIIAVDGSPLSYPFRVAAATIGSGQTSDRLVSVPASAGTAGESRYALYESNLLLHNSGAAGFGGMLTFIMVPQTGAPPGAGPVTSAVSLTPNPTGGADPVTLNATINSALNITAAEYFVDALGTSGMGCAMSGAFGSSTVAVNAVIPTSGATAPCADLATLPAGDHTFYVHGSDGTWGAYNFAVLHLDKEGPMTGSIVASPNPSFGNVAVSISAVGNDTIHGGSNVVAAEYAIDGMMGTWTAMTVNPVAPIAGLSGSIPAVAMSALAEGEHTLYVRSQDAFGHWGMEASAPLKVDQTGPVASPVTATPGTLYARAAVRVDVTLTDPLSGVAPFPGVSSSIFRAEGFIDTVGGFGTGFPFIPADGLFNSPLENAYATIPLATINALPEGIHTVCVRGQDSSGNWGAPTGASFTILPDLIFADGFESGSFSAWNGGSFGGVSVSAAAARAPSLRGMQVLLAGITPGYVADDSPLSEPNYRARFYFNPNGTLTGSATPHILAAWDATNSSQAVFRVEYRRRSAGGGTYEVRLVVIRAGGVTPTNWYAINNNAWNAIEISWSSGAAASARLYVNAVLRQTLNALNTSAYKVGSVWLGPSGGLGTAVSGTMFFDDFRSKRNTYIGP